MLFSCGGCFVGVMGVMKVCKVLCRCVGCFMGLCLVLV